MKVYKFQEEYKLSEILEFVFENYDRINNTVIKSNYKHSIKYRLIDLFNSYFSISFNVLSELNSIKIHLHCNIKKFKNIRDIKFAIGRSTDDESKLSYINFQNIVKSGRKVKFKHIESICGNNFLYLQQTHEDILRTRAVPSRVLDKYIDNQSYKSKGLNKHQVLELINRFYDKSTYEIKEVSGEEIRTVYLSDNYGDEACGTLWNSCMRYSKCQDWLDLYVDNDVKCVVCLKKGLVVGRCLIWSNKYYDRIYSTNEYVTSMIKQHCEEKYEGIFNENKEESFKLKYPLSHYNYYPYVDSFKYSDSIYLYTYEQGIYKLDSAEGCLNTTEETHCSNCGSELDDDNTECYSDYENESGCNDCMVYSNYHSSDIFRRHAVWSDYYNSYIDSRRSIYTEDEENVYESDAIYVEELKVTYSEKYYNENYEEIKSQIAEQVSELSE